MQKPARRPLPPWALVIGGTLVFSLALALALGILQFYGPVNRSAVRGLQEQTMPDGSVLVLEKVTVGTNHQFEWQPKQSFVDWLQRIGRPRHTASAWAPGNAVVVWLSRREAGTDKPLDFDWWQRSVAVDDSGHEFDDDNAGRNSFSGGSSSGLSGSRPFDPLSPGVYDLIVAHSAIVPFRHSGNSFKLRLYNTSGAVVAEFHVPHVSPAALPVWKADAFPATKKIDDYDATLTGLTATPIEVTEGTRKVIRYSLNPELAITREGRPTDDFGTREVTFEDPLGNTSYSWNPRLSRDEPAWKLKIKLWPGDKVVPDPAHEIKVDHVALADPKNANVIQAKRVLAGAAVEFVAAGGPERVVYTDAAQVGSGQSSYAGAFAGESFLVEVSSDRGKATTTTTVNCKWPHLLARVTGLDADQRLAVRMSGEGGRALATQQIQVSDQTVIFFQPAAGEKAVDAEFIVERAKKVEFYVEPPRLEK